MMDKNGFYFRLCFWRFLPFVSEVKATTKRNMVDTTITATSKNSVRPSDCMSVSSASVKACYLRRDLYEVYRFSGTFVSTSFISSGDLKSRLFKSSAFV